MAEVKFQYAYDENQQLVSIVDVTKENRKKHQYVCVGCGNPLLPRAIESEYRRPHFYHKQVVECSGETYLHKLAKRMFKEQFDAAESFEITYPVKIECNAKDCALRNEMCVDEHGTTTIDLKQYYDTCQEEISIEGFVADILLTSSTNPKTPPILVEVCVSHPCEEEKRNSGLKIIEIKIRNENDVKELLGVNHLTEEWGIKYGRREKGAVEFISFKRTLKEPKIVSITRYVFDGEEEHQTGYCTNINCQKAQYKIRKDSKWELNIISRFSDEREFVALYWMYKHYNVRRCSVCEYYYPTMYETYPICRLSKKYGKPKFPQMKEAEKCRSFRLRDLGSLEKSVFENVAITEVKQISPKCKEPYRVIVAGSSYFRDYDKFKEKCDYYLSSKMKTNDVFILVGTSVNTKEMIREYCKERDLVYVPFEAEWGCYERDAPKVCTECMLKHADAAIAFWDGKSWHTKHLIDSARQKGIKVAVVHVKVTDVCVDS